MSDLKFSCQHCSQHISCGPEYAGMQIKCPACQNDITIPRPAAATPAPAAAPSPGPLRVSMPSSHSAPPPSPPPPPSRSSAPPPPGAAVSGLSVARPAAPPPPQHVASNAPPPGGSVTTNTSPVVQWAGLIGAFLVTAIIVGMAATWKPPERTGDLVFVREKRGRKSVLVPKYKDSKPASEDAAVDEDGEEAQGATSGAPTTVPATPQWTLDLQAAHVPESGAAGQFGGRPFAPERAY